MKFFSSLALPVIFVALPIVVLSFGHLWVEDPLTVLVLAWFMPALYMGRMVTVTRGVERWYALGGLVSILALLWIARISGDPWLVAVKESVMPAAGGLVMLASELRGRRWGSWVFRRTVREEAVLKRLGEAEGLRYRSVTRRVGLLFALSLITLAWLNGLLALFFIRSEGGTLEFNQELARFEAIDNVLMVLLSVVVVGFLELYYLRAVRKLSGVSIQRLLTKKGPR